MDQVTLRSFTERYLTTNDCHILESTPHYLHTQLSVQADKDIVDRPFYWMYVERMNLPANPVQFCFVFDPEHPPEGMRSEYLFYGSPRFRQLLRSAQKQGRFVRLYQEPAGWTSYSTASKGYTPWLCINSMVSYVCDQKRDKIASFGINLQTAEVCPNFFEQLEQMKWTHKLPEKRHTLSPRMTIAEAVGELEYALAEELTNEEHQWANDAMGRLNEELSQVESFFPIMEKQSDEQKIASAARRRECIWQYHPRVEIKLINAGLFYLEG